jgi:hypothetical protein
LFPLQNWCNVGYAFINFLSTDHVVSFYKSFHGQRWKHFKSEKICQITYARIQGKESLIEHFARSRLLSEEKRCRPMILVEGKLVPLNRRFWPNDQDQDQGDDLSDDSQEPENFDEPPPQAQAQAQQGQRTHQPRGQHNGQHRNQPRRGEGRGRQAK